MINVTNVILAISILLNIFLLRRIALTAKYMVTFKNKLDELNEKISELQEGKSFEYKKAIFDVKKLICDVLS